MEKQKSIKKNMIMNSILTCSNFIFPLLTYSYAARILLPTGMGKVAFATAIIGYFSWIAVLGIPSYGLRQCAALREDKEKLSKLVQELFIINILSTIVAYIVLIFFISFVGKMKQETILILVISSSMLLNTLGMEWLYQGLEEYTYITIRSLIFKCISVFLIFLLIKNPNDYIVYGGLTIFTTSASNLCNFINARKFIITKPIKNREYKKHFRPLIALLSAAVIITLYANFDIAMLGFMKNDSQVGIYNAALKIKSIVLSVSVAITAVLIPRMSNFYQNNKFNEFRRLSVKSLRISLLLAVPLATYIFLCSSDVILFVSGSEYLAANTTLKILMLSTFALILTNLFGNQLLIPMCKEKKYTQSVFIGMFINIGINSLLIPRYGVNGAAIGTLVTEWFNVFFMSNAVKFERHYILKHIKIFKYAFALLISMILCIVTQYFVFEFDILFRLGLTTIAFFLPYYSILLLFKEPIIFPEFLCLIKRIICLLH